MAGGHFHALYHHGASPIHRLVPQIKIVAAFGFVLAVVATSGEAIWAFGLYLGAILATTATAGLPPGFVARRMIVEIPFVIVALLFPFFGGGERIDVLGLSLSVQGLWDMWNVLVKASLGLLVAILLGATTQVPDMLRGLDALRVPRVVTAIIAFMVRYIDVILGNFASMKVAMAARGYQPRRFTQWRPYAQTFGSMFVRTYERGERVYLAMTARGYAGSMPRSLHIPVPPTQWIGLVSALGAAWLVAVASMILR